MTEPDWNRWHNLLDIQAERVFTSDEQAEYDAFMVVVEKLDAADGRRSREHAVAIERKVDAALGRTGGIAMADLGEPLYRHPLPHGCIILDRHHNPVKWDIGGGPDRAALIDDILTRLNVTAGLNAPAIPAALDAIGELLAAIESDAENAEWINADTCKLMLGARKHLDAVRKPSPPSEDDGAGEDMLEEQWGWCQDVVTKVYGVYANTPDNLRTIVCDIGDALSDKALAQHIADAHNATLEAKS